MLRSRGCVRFADCRRQARYILFGCLLSSPLYSYLLWLWVRHESQERGWAIHTVSNAVVAADNLVELQRLVVSGGLLPDLLKLASLQLRDETRVSRIVGRTRAHNELKKTCLASCRTTAIISSC